MSIIFQKKYLKYKNKYLKLKNQRGGDEFIIVAKDGTRIDRDITTYVEYSNNNIVGKLLHKKFFTNNILKLDSEEKNLGDIFIKFNRDEFILNYNNNKIIINFIGNHKTFLIKLNDGILSYKVYLDVFNHDKKLYFDILNDFTFKKNNLTIVGEIKWSSKTIIEIVINNFSLRTGSTVEYLPVDYKINNINFFVINKEFNFEKFYDEIKLRFNFCSNSSILYKSIIHSVYTQFILNNQNIGKYISDNYSDYIESMLIKYLNESEEKIRNLCDTDEKRILILKNLMKKMNTSQDKNIKIQKKDGSNFISFGTKEHGVDLRQIKAVFDTGNAILCLVGERLLQQLGYTDADYIEYMPISISGVTGSPEIFNKLIKLKIKINNYNKNLDLGKEYDIIALVKPNYDDLLLGQSSQSLRPFFEDSYCISYDGLKNKYIRDKEDFDDVLKYLSAMKLKDLEQFDKEFSADITKFFKTRDQKLLKSTEYFSLTYYYNTIHNKKLMIDINQVEKINSILPVLKKIKGLIDRYDKIIRENSE